MLPIWNYTDTDDWNYTDDSNVERGDAGALMLPPCSPFPYCSPSTLLNLIEQALTGVNFNMEKIF